MSKTIPKQIRPISPRDVRSLPIWMGEGARVVAEAGAGLTCAAEDSAALAERILRLRAMPQGELRRMGDAGRAYYRKHFDPGA